MKVDEDGWEWKLNQRGWVGMGVISVPVQVSNRHILKFFSELKLSVAHHFPIFYFHLF